ncbi:MAG TPA: hypothetical protein PLV33_02540 [Opitutaceae bacterium]|jgi:hypothetical protein|nr:hypothetical protein [Opitutaceae bacterium]HOR24365.1 hypothetical protein [Opitutaceae bacterium]HPK48614.1 hypothetical protein [Opitutaceae bacterium]
MREISNQELTLNDLPASFDDWHQFAHTFNAYTYHGGMDECAEIANRKSPTTLTEYRTCLFFEARRWRHFGMEPEGDARRYIESLLAGIKSCLENGNRT